MKYSQISLINLPFSEFVSHYSKYAKQCTALLEAEIGKKKFTRNFALFFASPVVNTAFFPAIITSTFFLTWQTNLQQGYGILPSCAFNITGSPKLVVFVKCTGDHLQVKKVNKYY